MHVDRRRSRATSARADSRTTPELYNLDAVAYESVLLGLFTMFRGERPEREKPNDICLGFSRDGFHWDRAVARAVHAVSERQGDWNWGNVQSAGGCCLVVGDQLYFYVSGRTGMPGTELSGDVQHRPRHAATRRLRLGHRPLAVRARARRPRAGATLTTDQCDFQAATCSSMRMSKATLRIDVLDANGRAIAPFSADRMTPVVGNSTRHRVTWQGQPSLDVLRGQTVRFRFSLARADLFAFWVSVSESGHSGGYVAAGGPGFSRTRDVA